MSLLLNAINPRIGGVLIRGEKGTVKSTAARGLAEVLPEIDVVAEIERYIVNPGQACAYKVGQLKILELRDRARRRLGDRFDYREFHDRLLGNGMMPLAILERVVLGGSD